MSTCSLWGLTGKRIARPRQAPFPDVLMASRESWYDLVFSPLQDLRTPASYDAEYQVIKTARALPILGHAAHFSKEGMPMVLHMLGNSRVARAAKQRTTQCTALRRRQDPVHILLQA